MVPLAGRRLQAKSYDLIITDNKMPRMTGIEMIEKLRSASMAVPVIMATESLPTQEFARKPWLKPDATLQRPFSNDDLLAAVRTILRTDDGKDGPNEARTERTLRASEISYRRLFEAAKDGILILDADTGRINDVNPFLIKLLGFLTAKWSAKPSASLVRSRTSYPIKPCWSDYNRTDMSAMKTCHWKPGMAATLPWSLSATCIKPVTRK